MFVVVCTVCKIPLFLFSADQRIESSVKAGPMFSKIGNYQGGNRCFKKIVLPLISMAKFQRKGRR